jgi:hypothetical protein
MSFSVGQLYINGEIAALHKYKIQDQSACASVTVDKWMDSLELQMKKRGALKDGKSQG